MRLVGDPGDLPFQAGSRIMALALSPVAPLYSHLRLNLADPSAFRRICVGLCLDAPAAYFDPTVNGIVRHSPVIGRAFAQAAQALPEPDRALAQAWVLQGHGGGAAGPDPRYFWRRALKWIARAPKELDLSADDHRRVVDFALTCFDDIDDPDWDAALDEVLTAPYSESDIAVMQHLRFSLLGEAEVGDAINPVSVTLKPVRDWRIIEAHWRDAPSETRSALDRAVMRWSVTAGAGQRARGRPVSEVMCPFDEVIADA